MFAKHIQVYEHWCVLLRYQDAAMFLRNLSYHYIFPGKLRNYTALQINQHVL